MKFQTLALIASTAILSVASASASIITYDTAGSAYVTGGTGQTLTVTNGSGTATLTYHPPSNGSGPCTPANVCSVNAPSNISYGFFQITVSADGSYTIPAFTFDLLLSDDSDALPSVTITGTSSGGTITRTGPAGSSNVDIIWSPTSINEGTALFTITSPTQIVDPTTLVGESSIQGTVSPNTGTPEPTTMLLMGAGLLGVGFIARRKKA